MPHEPLGRDADLSEFLTSIDEIEARSDLDFLANLEDTFEDALEAKVPTTLWPDGNCN